MKTTVVPGSMEINIDLAETPRYINDELRQYYFGSHSVTEYLNMVNMPIVLMMIAYTLFALPKACVEALFSVAMGYILSNHFELGALTSVIFMVLYTIAVPSTSAILSYLIELTPTVNFQLVKEFMEYPRNFNTV